METIKKIILAVLVLALSFVIFLVVSENNALKTDILDNTLSLFSRPLFAMVSDGEDKQLVQQWYEDFIHKVKQQEIPPDRVEQVACIILNAENMDTTFSARDLTGMLDQALVLPRPEVAPLMDQLERTIAPAAPKTAVPKIIKPRSETEALAALNSRLAEIYQLNKDLKELQIAIKQKAPELGYHRMVYEFKVDSGVHVRIDPDLKERIEMIKSREIANRLREIERNERIIWRHGAPEIEEKSMYYLNAYKKYQEALKKVDSMQHRIIIRQDSMEKAIKIGNLDLPRPAKNPPENH